MAVSKGKTTSAAKSAPTGAAVKKRAKKELPKKVKKLLAHRTTRPLWAKIKRTAKKKNVAPETLLKKKPKFVIKKIAGEKNGGKRKVAVKKGRKLYPTEEKARRRRTGHITYKTHKRTLKRGLI